MESQAIRIASLLGAACGEAALGKARLKIERAISAGKIAEADLYRAVSVVLVDRGGLVVRRRAIGNPKD